VLVLFPGGNGTLNVFPGSRLSINASNFLVRSRWLFAAEGFHVATLDAASDFLQLPTGLRGLRGSGEHLSDVAAVIADLRAWFPGLPVWLVTTSRGTGGAYAAALLGPAPTGPDGLVLTSPLTRGAPADGDSLELVPLEQVTVPTLIVVHQDDACPLTPPEDANMLKQRLRGSAPRVTAFRFAGGSTPLSDPCDALSPHGYFGIEPRVVGRIAHWITQAPQLGGPNGTPARRP